MLLAATFQILIPTVLCVLGLQIRYILHRCAGRYRNLPDNLIAEDQESTFSLICKVQFLRLNFSVLNFQISFPYVQHWVYTSLSGSSVIPLFILSCLYSDIFLSSSKWPVPVYSMCCITLRAWKADSLFLLFCWQLLISTIHASRLSDVASC